MAGDQEHGRKQAEKAFQRAEELFLTGNIRGAHLEASKAKRLCPSLAAAASALAAYEVHAGGADWHAVLGLPRGGAAVTPDAVKRRFRRLSLLVHPDKNRSAAAEGAFKLLRQARDAALSSSSVAASGGAATSPYAAPDEPETWWREEARREKEEERRREEARRRAWRRRPLAEEPAVPYRVIYCPFCKRELARPCGPLQERAGMLCTTCHRWLSPPWKKKPEPPPPPPQKKKPAVFPCPAQCPECGARYTSKVCVGEWCLQCKACSKRAVVSVQGPDVATAAIKVCFNRSRNRFFDATSR